MDEGGLGPLGSGVEVWLMFLLGEGGIECGHRVLQVDLV